MDNTNRVSIGYWGGYEFGNYKRLLVEGKRDAIIVDINAIALLRQAIGSSPGRNDGTPSPESIGSRMDVDIFVDDEALHKLISMVEKNELFKKLMIVVVDTKQNFTEVDS
ncbi:hypothetical protein Tco_0491913 [Tanacetum coccineum]